MSFTENYWWMNGSCTPLPCLLWSWSFSKLHLHQFLHLTFRVIWAISENKITCTEHQKDGLPSKNHFEGYFILYNWLTYFLYLSVILRQSILLWIVIPSLSTVQQFCGLQVISWSITVFNFSEVFCISSTGLSKIRWVRKLFFETPLSGCFYLLQNKIKKKTIIVIF